MMNIMNNSDFLITDDDKTDSPADPRLPKRGVKHSATSVQRAEVQQRAARPAAALHPLQPRGAAHVLAREEEPQHHLHTNTTAADTEVPRDTATPRSAVQCPPQYSTHQCQAYHHTRQY